MSVSVVDLFSIGIGPSSSHTVGPMRAARRFAVALARRDLLGATTSVRAELFGSLAATGRGHGTDRAVLLGLEGDDPETVDPDRADAVVARVRADRRLHLLGRRRIRFDLDEDLVLHLGQSLPRHPNGMRFTAYDMVGASLHEVTSYSVGGGFVVEEDEADGPVTADGPAVPFAFTSAAELLDICARHDLAISDVMLANERAARPEAEVLAHLAAGCRTEGILPGGLRVPRRAPALHRRLLAGDAGRDPLAEVDWINLFALAVTEENAGGGRVVTAPTNGAAGIIPAVLHHHVRTTPDAGRDDVRRFLLTSATPRSPVPRWAARARSARRRRWRRPGCARCSAALRVRSRTPPRSRWSTTSG